MNKLKSLLFLVQNIQVMPDSDKANLAEEIRSAISGDYQMNVGLVDAGIYAPLNDALNALQLNDPRGFKDNIVEAEMMLERFNVDETIDGVIDGVAYQVRKAEGTLVLKELGTIIKENAEISYQLSEDAVTELVLRHALPGRHFLAISDDLYEYPASEDCYEYIESIVDKLASQGIEAFKELSSEPFSELSVS